MTYTVSVHLSDMSDRTVLSQAAASIGADIVTGDESASVRVRNAGDAILILKRLAREYGRDRIILQDDDGWECSESDLIGEKAIGELFRRLFTDGMTGSEMPEETISGKRRLILASTSPRRKEYLKLTGVPFGCESAELDEAVLARYAKDLLQDEPFGVGIACTVMHLAREKARPVLANHPDAVVLGSDTLVALGGQVLTKPATPEDAYGMLQRLAGRDHHVYTGVSLISRDREETFFVSTRVRFLPWSERIAALARTYVETGLPLDKAGAYGIQDMGALFISMIRGDYYTVVGLPVARVAESLIRFDLS